MQLKENMNLGNHKLIIFFLFLSLSLSVNSETIKGVSAEIKILDKITAKINTIAIQVNDSFLFESLKIEIYACLKQPPEQIPEDFVLLKIYDQMKKIDDELLYQGWMISSSPSTTPLEHPIYDLWLIECKIDNDF